MTLALGQTQSLQGSDLGSWAPQIMSPEST